MSKHCRKPSHHKIKSLLVIEIQEELWRKLNNLKPLFSHNKERQVRIRGSILPARNKTHRKLMWVEFVVGSLPCSERFFSGFFGFLLSSKTNTSKFQFDQKSGGRRTTMWMCYLQIVIYLFIYLFMCHDPSSVWNKRQKSHLLTQNFNPPEHNLPARRKKLIRTSSSILNILVSSLTFVCFFLWADFFSQLSGKGKQTNQVVACGFVDVSNNRLKWADVSGIRLPFNYNL